MIQQINQLMKAFRVFVFDLVTIFFRRDYKVKAEAVKRSGHALQHVSTSLQNEKQLVLMAVKQNGFALVHASKSLQNDREVVMAAVQEKGCSLIHASKALQNDKEIVSEAVKKSHGVALIHASKTLKSDKDFVLTAMTSGYALRYVSESLKNDKEIVLAAVKRNCEAYQFASHTLKTDIDVILEATSGASKLSAEVFQRMNRILDQEFIIETLQNEAYKQGRNILCFALSIGLPWKYGMKKIVQNNPNDYRSLDEKTGLFPVMLAAASYHAASNLDMIYEVLLSCPDVLQCKK